MILSGADCHHVHAGGRRQEVAEIPEEIVHSGEDRHDDRKDCEQPQGGNDAAGAVAQQRPDAQAQDGDQGKVRAGAEDARDHAVSDERVAEPVRFQERLGDGVRDEGPGHADGEGGTPR